MFKNKVFILAVSILIAITLILVAAFVLWNYMEKSGTPNPSEDAQASAEQVKPTKPPTAAQTKANTVFINDITTNLAGGDHFIKVSFAFELENSKAKEEFENLLESTVKGTINRTLVDMTPEQVEGSKGQDFLTSTLMNKLNPMLQDGKIRQVWITYIVLQ
ncbi:flagellar basal body-associated FliL family protein [Paenibacillus eucommiae]|uniref:Flagellar protein FliL n=1 Tax=Paenibacillus eucommiae TaxID=1355755 RepID=A0ABS4IW75_9BACL|nr:flagellar basal body-associated FliL family protein [Paenibacillus eucommiae]MBP1991330.1 flagellar FliL protein [Paenibacillus eucommiae]